MKILTKALILSTLGFMFVFLCVGYAQFTTSLDVDGNVDVNVPEGLFITDMTELSTSNIDRNDYYFVPQTTNVVNCAYPTHKKINIKPSDEHNNTFVKIFMNSTLLSR